MKRSKQWASGRTKSYELRPQHGEKKVERATPDKTA
jgi:hypothetical protein